MSEYRLKLGTVTAANIDADSNAIVTSFGGTPTTGYEWAVVADSFVRRYVNRETSLTGKMYTSGLVNFEWKIAILNDTQYDYWLSTFYANGEQSVAVTVKTHARNYETTKWQVFNALMHLPEDTMDELNSQSKKWFHSFLVRFTNATVAAAS